MNALSRKSFASVCAALMIVMIFQNVSAEGYNTGEDMDIFIDSHGNEHQVWRKLVNGTYQVFYGYEVADSIYNTNYATHSNQSINNNIDFDDGSITITNCSVNGNIKLTQANAFLQDCNINGNVKIDLGRLQIFNCSINGNLETKNADLEIRYSDMNGNLQVKQSSYENIDSIIIANEINGNLKVKGGTCYIVGNTIKGNLQVQDPAIIHQVIDNTVNGNIQLTDNTQGFDGYQITNSTSDVQYPQCTVDSITHLGYILWVENDSELYYVGTDDFVVWSQPILLASINATINPELNIVAMNGTFSITSNIIAQITFISDIDGDFFPDNFDTNPILYDAFSYNSSFVPDSVTIDVNLGISVAVDWKNDSSIRPIISPVVPANLLVGSIAPYVDISLPDGDFTVLIKYKYSNSTLSRYINEDYLRIFAYEDAWRMVGDVKGWIGSVNTENNYVWAKTSELSIVTVADASATDLNVNGIPDIWDISETSDEENPNSDRLSIYSGDSLAPQIYISPDDIYHMAWIDNRDGSPAIFYKQSMDYGETWTTDTSLTVSCLEIPSISFSGYNNHLAIAYTENYQIEEYINSNVTVLESLDGGITWEILSIPMCWGVNPCISVHENEIYLVYDKIIPSGVNLPSMHILEGLQLSWTEDGIMNSQILLSTESEAQHLVPKICVDNNEIFIVWAGYFEGEDYSYNKIFYTYREIGETNWGDIEEITSYYGDNDPYAISFAAKNDILYLAWADDRNGEFEIYGKWSVSNSGMWSEDIRLTVSDLPSRYPNLFIDTEETIQLVWQEGTTTESEIYHMELNPTTQPAEEMAIGELPELNDGNSYQLTRVPDEIYQILTETDVPALVNANSESLITGNLVSGSIADTFNSDNQYEKFSPEIANNPFQIVHSWYFPISSETSFDLYFESKISQNFGAHQLTYSIWYSFDNGGTYQILGTYSNMVDNTYEFQLTSTNSATQCEVQLRYSHATISGITISVDRVQIGLPTTAMKMTHDWVMDITVPQSTTHTFFIKGYMTSSTSSDSNEGDNFLFSYSLDNSNYINMLVLDKIAEDGNYLQYALPPILAGTVYIRVIDTIQADNEVIDSLFIDHMYIESIYNDIGIITPAKQISSDQAVSSGYPSVSMNSLGDLYAVWQDCSYDNFEVIAMTDGSESSEKTSPIIQMLAGLDDSMYSEETEYNVEASTNVPSIHKDALISQLNLLCNMLEAEDYITAFSKIQYDIIPYIDSAILDVSTKGEVINALTIISDLIEPMGQQGSPPPPPGPPVDLWVSTGTSGGDILVDWAPPIQGGNPTKYLIYRTTNPTIGTSITYWNYYINMYNNNEGNEYNIAHVDIPSSITNFTNRYYNDASTPYDDRMVRWVTTSTTTPAELQFEITYYYAVIACNSGGLSGPQIELDNSASADVPTLVTSFTPSSGATAVSTTTLIDIYFNKPMNSTSVESKFTLTYLGNAIQCSATWPTTKHVQFQPSGDLTHGTIYTVTLLAYARATDGLHTQTKTQWTFTTELSGTPEVVWWSPQGDEVSSGPIIVTFTNEMNPSSVENAFVLNGYYSGIISGFTFSWSTDYKTITATHSSHPISEESYTITIAGTVQDIYGTAIANGGWTSPPFRTLINVFDPVLTTTAQEYLLSWPAIGNPRSVNPYEILFSDDLSEWTSLGYTTSTTYVMDTLTYGIYGLKPHNHYYFKVRAYNTAECHGISIHKGADCGRVDYFLDVGNMVNAHVYGGRDMPSYPNMMHDYGLTLTPIPADQVGWSTPIENSTFNWRRGTQAEYQRFFFNLGWNAELHIDYMLTLRYYASGTFNLEQLVAGGSWLPVGVINGHNLWETTTILLDHNNYFDYSGSGDWDGMNVQFRFSDKNVIYLDWIKAEPQAYYADIQKVDFEDITKHSPGVCLNPGDWSAWDSGVGGRLGTVESKIQINLPSTQAIDVPYYRIKVTYKSFSASPEDSEFSLYDGTSFVPIDEGCIITDQNWHSVAFKINPEMYYDYDPSNLHYNLIIKSNVIMYISEVELYHISESERWTVMVYFVGDNEIEPLLINEFQELEAIGSGGKLDIVALFDRSSQDEESVYRNQGADGFNPHPNWPFTNEPNPETGDWGSEAKMFHVLHDTNLNKFAPYEENINSWDLGEIECGNPDTLKNFIDWSTENFPAEHYGLIMVDHGQGWRWICREYAYADFDRIDMPELKNAIISTGIKFDFIGFDACVMNQIEVLYQLMDCTHFIVGTEHSIGVSGWPLPPMLEPLKNELISPYQICKHFAQTYISVNNNPLDPWYPPYYDERSAPPMSVLSTAKIIQFVTQISTFADELLNSLEEYRDEIEQISYDVYTSQVVEIPGWGVDIYILAELIRTRINNDELQQCAINIINQIPNIVCTIIKGPIIDNPLDSGISIFFYISPKYTYSYPTSLETNYRTELDFAYDTTWDEFLLAFYAPYK